MKNVEATLKEAGLDFRNVVMSHVFYDDPKNIEAVGKVYSQSFADGNEPACATVLVDWIPGGSHVEVTCIATTDLARRKVVRPAGLNGRVVKSSGGVWAGDTLYLSGLAGVHDATVSPGLDAQVHQMAKNHVGVLDAAGLSLEDIVSGHVYLADMGDYAPMNAIYRQYFSKGPGVRTCLMPSTKRATEDVLVIGSFVAAKAQVKP
jgi:enamine deaminase RidA (YjgF/YER057c/UK114 family)